MIPFVAPDRARGFSLIEMLAVVVVIGISAAVLLLSADLGGAGARQRDTGRELAAVMSLLCEEAVLLTRQRAVHVDDLGVRFLTWEGGAWVDLEDPVFRPRPFLQPMSWRLAVGGRSVQTTDPETPAVVCYASGELTPFELTLDHQTGGRVTIRGTAAGRVRVAEGSDA
ncbi:MAG: GspH/FimT family pseudopilin [Pseudomonadota bacterium]